MSVIPLTLFFSLLLAGIFVTLFALVFDRRRFASAERESLLPLADEAAHAVVLGPRDEHEHEPAAGGGCACRLGLRPPCAGCVRAHALPAPAARLLPHR